MELVRARLKEHVELFGRLQEDVFLEKIKNASDRVLHCLKAGNKVLLCGNGGSAADAQHAAAELVGRFRLERKPLPAIALTTNTSILTALGNDYDFSVIFEKQVEALGLPGDVLVGISTSGNSESVLKAIRKSREKKMISIALTGKEGGLLKGEVDTLVDVPSKETPRIQEAHTAILHILCELVESSLFRA